MHRILLGVLIASEGDETWMEAQKGYGLLDASLGKSHWLLASGSAEKNPTTFRTTCFRLRDLGVKVVITAAGLNPVIGRVAAAEFGAVSDITVICVPETEATVVTTLWCPETAVLTCTGWGKRGFFNACIEACKRLSVYDPEILTRLNTHLTDLLKNKQPQFDVRGALREEFQTAAAAAPIPEK